MAKSEKPEIEWGRWRWEFMRRSPEYRADYEMALELRERAEHKPFLEKSGVLHTLDYHSTTEWREEFKLCLKYQILPDYLPDPEKSFDELPLKGAINPMSVHCWPNIPRPGILRIEVDFSAVNSVAELTKQVSKEILRHYDQYGKKAKKNMTGEKGYGNMLWAGDLHFKEGLTQAQVAKKLFPRDFKDDNEHANPESAIMTAGNYCRDYERLVMKGGYKSLSFP